MNQHSEIAWEEETLIMHFYGELDAKTAQALDKALVQSPKLSKQYQTLVQFLSDGIEQSVPEASKNFEQNIMAALMREADQKETQSTSGARISDTRQSSWWRRSQPLNLLAGSAVMATLLIGVFFVGRWSSQVEPQQQIASNNQGQSSVASNLKGQQSEFGQRVLFTRVHQHIESSERLFTLVANGNGELPQMIAERKKIIDELLALNRIYRRISQQQGDTKLAYLLEGMETMLLELNNLQPSNTSGEQSAGFENVKRRLENTDLLFKMRVTNKKVEQKII